MCLRSFYTSLQRKVKVAHVRHRTVLRGVLEHLLLSETGKPAREDQIAIGYLQGKEDEQIRFSKSGWHRVADNNKITKLFNCNVKKKIKKKMVLTTPPLAYRNYATDVNNPPRVRSVSYHELTKLFNEIEALNSRLEIIDKLSNFFTMVWKHNDEKNIDADPGTVASPADTLLQIVYLTCNKLAPQFENVEMV